MNSTSFRPRLALAVGVGDLGQANDEDVEVGAVTLDQARFWARVYDEIMAMEVDVLARMESLLATQSREERLEVGISNVTVIAAQMSRFQRRRAIWEDRVKELQPPNH